MSVLADEEVRSAFFRTLSSNRAGRISGNKAKTLIIMQTTASLQRTAHLRPLSVNTPSVRKALGAWLNAKSELFTILCGFDCTRREVLRVNLVALFMIVGAAAAETSLLVTLVCVALAGYNVYRLNQEDNDNWLHDEEQIEAEAQKGGRR